MVGQELTIGALLSARTDWLAFCKSDQAAKTAYISARQAARRLRVIRISRCRRLLTIFGGPS